MKSRYKFLVENLAKGLIWFAALILVFVLAREYLNLDSAWIDAIYNQPVLVYTSFILSEVIFGIIPPELYMIWSLKGGLSQYYAINILFLALLSYGAGVLGYFIGSKLRGVPALQRFEEKHLLQYKSNLRKFGGFLVIAAALTPLPFSAIAMAVGAFKYPYRFYLIYSLTRFLRFGVYGYIVWQANSI